MGKRPGAAAVTGGALLALLCPGAGSAVAQDAGPFPRPVSGGYASWTTADAEPADHDMTIAVGEPATGGSVDRAWFPATGGGADPESGAAEIELGGTARILPASDAMPPLTLGGLRLELDGGDDGGSGALYARTTTDGHARELALAAMTADGAAPAVRAGGVTWAGLRASLTGEGARLLAEWSGEPFAEGDPLGRLDVTVGTGSAPSPGPGGSAPPAGTPSPSPDTTAPNGPKQPSQPDRATPSSPAATVSAGDLAAGGEQTVRGAGFEPGEVVLVAIDADTRYQAVADEEGRVSRAFPVYATSVEGTHTVELRSVTGERVAATRFEVRPSG
ncbi:hypothetical protein [Streptomyces viridochromogenes]|uniref:hypothetical protein n=1 Tax=Streptomyces viridochromogenes TaxID=1938 RepID=UPI000ADA18E9|nr:hypothetical protein [Streptomyces viridochromogenes]